MDQSEDKKTEDLHTTARETFERAKEANSENQENARQDIRFAKLGEQWPDEIKANRQAEQRPCLTINKQPAFIRQVVNDARQNKPAIKVKPVDSGADPATAEVMSGLIRNIEHVSSADVAYDTAVDNAVSSGIGYIRVGIDYAYDDTFDLDITIDRVINPLSIYPDPWATSADGSDWNDAFVTDRISREEFKRKYGSEAAVDFDDDGWTNGNTQWVNDDGVLIAEWWHREEVEREIHLLSDDNVYTAEQIEENEELQELLATGVLEIVRSRQSKTHKVTQYIMSGKDILETNDWPGRYIPIVPVYGDEFCIEGKRYHLSLIHHAKDAQRMFNFWRTQATELTALAPRTPWVGPKGAFDSDSGRWATANTKSHPYLEYDGGTPPQRQPIDGGVAAGSLQEALNASDDMKAIVGIHDASMGARSNETSGKAIIARQREGDVSTFHFIDNLARAIRHTGRIIIDLIPHVYNEARIVRVLGEDGKEETRAINQETPALDEDGNAIVDENDAAMMAIYDLTAGKYDLAVDAGPSFTTKREEAATQMTELIRTYPDAAPIMMDILARNLDWPGADEIAKRFEKMNPINQQELPPEVQKQLQELKEAVQALQHENRQLKDDTTLEHEKIQVSQYEAVTDRMKAEAEIALKATAPAPAQVPERMG